MAKEITGWKGFSQILGGIPPETIRYWHNNLFPIPLYKSHPGQQGRVVSVDKLLLAWFEYLLKFYPTIYKTRHVVQARKKLLTNKGQTFK